MKRWKITLDTGAFTELRAESLLEAVAKAIYIFRGRVLVKVELISEPSPLLGLEVHNG